MNENTCLRCGTGYSLYILEMLPQFCLGCVEKFHCPMAPVFKSKKLEEKEDDLDQ